MAARIQRAKRMRCSGIGRRIRHPSPILIYLITNRSNEYTVVKDVSLLTCLPENITWIMMI
jgi:hypothetical protein